MRLGGRLCFRLLFLSIGLFLSTRSRLRAWHFFSLLNLHCAVLCALETLFEVLDASLFAESVPPPEFHPDDSLVEEN